MGPDLLWWDPKAKYPNSVMFASMLADPEVLKRYYASLTDNLRYGYSHFSAVRHYSWPAAKGFMHNNTAKIITTITRHTAGLPPKRANGLQIPISNFSWVPLKT